MGKSMRLFVIAAGLLFSGLTHAATWSGGGADSNWMTGQNWGGTPPVAGDDLIFPDGFGQTTNNNFTAGTTFHSITLSDTTTGYTITGNSIVLTAGASALSSTAGTNLVGIDITFSTLPPTIQCLAGTLTLSGALANGGLLLSFDCSAPITVSGAISGSGGLNLIAGSSSTLSLSANNAYSGTTTIDAGTLSAQKGGALGVTAVVVNSGGTLQLDASSNVSLPLTLNGMGAGAGALSSASGANTWSGNITLGSPSFIGCGLGSLSLTAPGALSLGGNNLTFVGSGAIVVNQVISGTGNVNVAGVAGVAVSLNSVNTYTGTTGVSVGTLIAGNDVTSNVDGPFGHSATAVQVGSSFNAILEVAGSVFTRPINVVGSGSALILADTNADISGAIAVSSPLGLTISTNNGTPASISGSINNGGFPLSLQPLPGHILTVSGAISGAGPISCDAPGRLVLSSAANSYSGPIGVNFGTIQAGIAAAILATTDLVIAPTGVLDANNFSVTVNSINGLGGIALGSGALTVASTGPAMAYGGVISGVGGSLTLSSGNLKLTGNNTYTGATTVNGGVLTVDGSQSSSAIAVNAGAALQGTGTVGAVTVTGGVVAVGDPPATAGTFNTGAVTLDAASQLKLNLSGFVAGASMDVLNSSGVFTAAGVLNLDLAGLSAPGTAAGIVKYTSASGVFSSVTLSNNPNNYTAKLTFNATQLDVQLSAPVQVQAAQTITFAALPDRVFGDAPFTVTATASSNLPVSFSIASGPATIANGVVTLTGVGTVTVQADQTGNASFLPAPSVTQSFKVTALIDSPGTLLFANPFVDPSKIITVERDLGDAIVGSALRRHITTLGGAQPYKFNTANLPALSNNSVTLDGTGLFRSTSLQTMGSGNLTFNCNAIDVLGARTSTEPFRLNVLSGQNQFRIAMNKLSDGVQYREYLDNLDAINGAPPYQFSVSGNVTVNGQSFANLAAIGLTLNESDGTVSGIPLMSGLVSFQAACTDKNGAVARSRDGTAVNQLMTFNIQGSTGSAQLTNSFVCTYLTIKTGFGKNKDSVSFKGVANLNTTLIASLAGSDLKLQIQGYSLSAKLNSKGIASTGKGIAPAFSGSVRKYGVVGISISKTTLNGFFGPFATSLTNAVVGLSIGDVTNGTQVLSLAVKTSRSGSTLTYKGDVASNKGGRVPIGKSDGLR